MRLVPHAPARFTRDASGSIVILYAAVRGPATPPARSGTGFPGAFQLNVVTATPVSGRVNIRSGGSSLKITGVIDGLYPPAVRRAAAVYRRMEHRQ